MKKQGEMIMSKLWGRVLRWAKKKIPQKKRGDPYFCGPYSYGHKPPEFIETQCEKCEIVTRHQRHYSGGYMDYDGHCEWYYYQCQTCNTRWFYIDDTVKEVTDHELTRDHGEHTDNPCDGKYPQF